MAHEETVILDKLIKERKIESVLEWGGGGSTIYFPNKHKKIKVWNTIEHDLGWYYAIKEHKDFNKRVNLFYQPGKKYFILPTKQVYDLIIVDGRDEGNDRVKCMAIASMLLTKKGVAILHDSGRLKYRKGYKHFTHNLELAPGVGHGKDGGADFRGLTMFWNEK